MTKLFLPVMALGALAACSCSQGEEQVTKNTAPTGDPTDVQDRVGSIPIVSP